MHELSITQEVVAAITARLPDTRITVVRLEIGKLSGVVADSVRFCFDLVTEGTAVEGAALVIEEPAGRARCRACVHEYEAEWLVVLCPECGSAAAEVLSGNELRITSVEVSRECAAPADALRTR
ncbi:hydrogenase maturation nickel metallochaperone HypA [Lentzea flava]|uniref:Hydrogenase maturation factor HypA n=1 Tax=Lentzea flava TaxID=103732 RepID=A0ABQ2URH1_9PSEU|nr:hydrogenase maturation nickel metallochaperone HypA [Lentzea flava]MCP2197277.1 hydrogenase nickel incorporation protein HypA/HybF [Lentzea flava]GGU50262.1 hydrogenase nickel incorporation protein HypA [Lentzea flava]